MLALISWQQFLLALITWQQLIIGRLDVVYISRVFADSDKVTDIHTNTGIVVASLTQGDTVHVEFGNIHNFGTLHSNNGDNSFSGWILE